MLRVAIIGCGKIADQHVAAIRRIPGSQVVALCDRELLMAKQLGERFAVTDCYADAAEMLRVSRPDVVHITTPPQGHFSLASQCLESNCNVYLEKPFTIDAPEAARLIELAEAHKVKITAGHNLQFTTEMVRLRKLVSKGFLGGKPILLESYFSYDLGDTSYVGPMLNDKSHWVRRLPGQLFHNIISHGIAKLAEFLDDEIEEIVARASQSPKLRAMGSTEIMDELRVMIRDKSGTSAYFTFTTQVKPGLNQFRVCGSENSATVDHASGSLIRHKTRSYKSYLTYFAPPVSAAWEHFANSGRNIADFLRRRLYQDSGMKELIERFYQSIQTGSAPPIPYREILITAQIMDSIFEQVYRKNGEQEMKTETAAVI